MRLLSESSTANDAVSASPPGSFPLLLAASLRAAPAMASCRRCLPAALLLLALALPSARSRCAFVQDDINDCPLPWPTDPAQTRCVPRPAGWSDDGTDRSAELHAHPFVPFNNTPGDPTTYVPNVCPQFPEVCCSNYQMCARPLLPPWVPAGCRRACLPSPSRPLRSPAPASPGTRCT